MGKTKTITLCAVLTALALALSYTERLIPLQLLIPVPGIKLGLANIVTIFAVWIMGSWQGVGVLAVRVFLGAVFSGNFGTIFYSAAGGALAILTAILLKKILKENQLWVAGCLGAVAHSIGQMVVAILLTGTPGLAIYLPVMIACGIVTGLFTGLCAQLRVNRGEKFWKTTFK